MDTFTLVQRALDASADDPAKQGLDKREIEYGRITTAVQTVVDALTPPDGGRYIVGFSDISTAQTSLGERKITVSSKPIRDASLTLVEKAVVIATFAAHEIGHTYVTAPRKALIPAHNPHSGYHAVTNLADDIILEPVMVDRYPILADAFEFTGQWVLKSTAGTLPKVVTLRRSMTTPERFNLLLSATRYGDIPEIVWAGKASIAERDWCRAWADRLISARLADHDTFLALCDEAWERIRSKAEDENEEEPPVIVEPPVGPSREPQPEPPDKDGEDEGPGGSEDGEDEDDDGEPDEDEDEPTDDGEDEDEDGEDEDTGKGGDEPTDDVNEQPRDWDDDEGEGEDEAEDEGNPVPPTETDNTGKPGHDGGGGDPEADADDVRDEDDFDQSAVDQSMHDQSERDPRDWDAMNVDKAVRKYSSTTVTAFGKHGSLSTVWS